MEEGVAQHRLGAHPLRLSVTVKDPAEGKLAKQVGELGSCGARTQLLHPIKPYLIRYYTIGEFSQGIKKSQEWLGL